MKKNMIMLAMMALVAAMCNGCFLPMSWQAAIVRNHDAVDAAVGVKPEAAP